MAKKIDLSVAEPLRQMYELQLIDSSIDEIMMLKGELPNEVNDLEDEIAGLHTRLVKLDARTKEINQEIANELINIKNAEQLIIKYNEQLKLVKNNREYESLNKEVEDQTLNIQMSKKTKDRHMVLLQENDTVIENTKPVIESRTATLAAKRIELDKITEKTDKEEEKLRKRAEKYRKDIDDRLLKSYDKVRTSYRNGLAVVSIVRNSCGGCYNVIPPQTQLEIGLHKRIIVCEHCGRILVDEAIRTNNIEPAVQ